MFFGSALTLYVTGANDYGKLGLGTDKSKQKQQSSYQQIESITEQLSQVVAGWNGAVAVTQKGEMYGWGSNQYGQLASDDHINVTSPKLIAYFTDNKLKVKQAVVGYWHTLVLTEDGDLYSFGDNSQNQLGRKISTENVTADHSPCQVDLSQLQEGEAIVEIQAAGFISYFLTNFHNLYHWGSCDGNLCPNTQEMSISVPKKANITQKITYFHVGDSSVWFLDDNKTLFALGDNKYGQLCIDPLITNSTNQPQKTQPYNVQMVKTSHSHSLILQQDSVLGCGCGDSGQLGNQTTNKINYQPLQLLNESNKVIDIAATYEGTLLLSNQGLYASGHEYFGELSINHTEKPRLSIDLVVQPYDWKKQTNLTAINDVSFIYYASSKAGMSAGAIAGIVIGSVAGVVIFAVLIVLALKASKHQNNYNNERNKETDALQEHAEHDA